MTVIDNKVGVPHFWFEQTDANGERIDVLVVRGTFDFSNSGDVMALAREQTPVALGDLFDGPIHDRPLRAVLTEDGDLVPFKPATDIIVTGNAHSPNGIPHGQWHGRLRVGSTEKRLCFYGRRQMTKRLFGWKMSAPEPVVSISLDYRLAYGGAIDVPAGLLEEGDESAIVYSGNPAGCGWLPTHDIFDRYRPPIRDFLAQYVDEQRIVTAPQIESSTDPVLNPFDDRRAHGFGPVARWCTPRVGYQGTYDMKWLTSRYPLFPKDFDTRYFLSAHPDLVTSSYLEGDEAVILDGLLPQLTEMTLPGWQVIAVVERESGEHTISLPVLDTVRFDLDRRKASLVWRAIFTADDPPVEITIGATKGYVRAG